MGIILFIVIFCVIVVAHEFGHFIIAKAGGIHVVEFCIGMGPAILKFKKGETLYALRLLPIGGACMFEGEDGLNKEKEEESEEEAFEKVRTKKPTGAFPDAPVAIRLATVLAGPIFNFLLAFLFSLIIVASVGSDLPIVQSVSEESAALEAGLQEGDEILKIDNARIHLFREISLTSMLNEGKAVDVTYTRNGETFTTVLTPKYSKEADRYYYGISGGAYTKLSPANAVLYSGYEVKYWIDATLKSLGMLFTGKAGMNDLSGPVGMAGTVDEIYTESKADGAYYVWLNMLNFAILLSANLGVLNLLPVPALDGGRVLFLLVEAIRKKPIPPEKEGVIHFVGFALLMLLMVVVMYNDIMKLFVK